MITTPVSFRISKELQYLLTKRTEILDAYPEFNLCYTKLISLSLDLYFEDIELGKPIRSIVGIEVPEDIEMRPQPTTVRLCKGYITKIQKRINELQSIQPEYRVSIASVMNTALAHYLLTNMED